MMYFISVLRSVIFAFIYCCLYVLFDWLQELPCRYVLITVLSRGGSSSTDFPVSCQHAIHRHLQSITKLALKRTYVNLVPAAAVGSGTGALLGQMLAVFRRAEDAVMAVSGWTPAPPETVSRRERQREREVGSYGKWNSSGFIER